MARGIKDKVAILGMGCSKFGERWDAGAEELMLEAYKECLADAGIDAKQLNAAWFSTAIDEVHVGKSGIPLSTTCRLPNIPVTHVENMCASGTEAFRGACYAVASGAADFALALGVEKLKDTGYGGLPGGRGGPLQALWNASGTAPGNFAQLATAYMTAHGVSGEDLKKAIGHVSWKSHQNGAKNPKAHLQKAVEMDTILNAPMIASPLGLFDCCGVSDGAAAAIVTTPEIARALGKRDLVTLKAVQLSVSSGLESTTDQWDGSYVRNTRNAATKAYKEAGITKPRDQLGLIEVHDCFSITELVTMEDLFLSDEGRAVTDVLDGFYDRDGRLPCQVDGGLKCFGHPIGASGLRMMYEVYNQLLGRAGERQLADVSLGLTHNLGGVPYLGVAAISILGLH